MQTCTSLHTCSHLSLGTVREKSSNKFHGAFSPAISCAFRALLQCADRARSFSRQNFGPCACCGRTQATGVITDLRSRANTAAQTAANDEFERAQTLRRFAAGEPTDAERSALKYVCDQMTLGTLYDAALLMLQHTHVLTQGQREGVAAIAYKVGEPLTLGEAGEEGKLDKYFRPEAGAMAPEIDVDDLFGARPIVAQRVREVAAATLVTPCMPAIAALAMFSIACAARVRGVVRNRDGSLWRMYPNQFFGVEAVSGGKKSMIRKLMGGNLLNEYAADVRGRWATFEATDKHERGVAEARLSRLRAAEVAGKPSDPPTLAALHARLNRPVICAPEIMLSGGTPEAYVRRLRSSGYCALVPDEGKQALDKFIGGHDGNGEKCSPLLSAHTVEFYVNDTLSGETRGDSKLPFSVICGGAYLPMQPAVLTPATAHEAQLLAAIQSRGLLARMLVARPRLLTVAERQTLRDKMDAGEIGCAAMTAYDNLLRSILWSEHDDHPLAPSNPYVRTFTPAANAAFLAFQAEAEDSAAPDGKYCAVAGSEFVRRQADHVARLALELSVIREGVIRDGVVELEDVERAIRAMKGYFLPHALSVAGRTVFDPISDDADRIWQVLAAEGTIKQRDLARKVGRGWTKARSNDKHSRLEVAIEELENRGRVVVSPAPRGSRVIRVVGRCA